MLVTSQNFTVDLIKLHIVFGALVERAVTLRQLHAQVGTVSLDVFEVGRGLAKPADEFAHALLGLVEITLGRFSRARCLRDGRSRTAGMRLQRVAFLFDGRKLGVRGDRKSTRLNSSHQIISYAVFSLKKKIHHPS